MASELDAIWGVPLGADPCSLTVKRRKIWGDAMSASDAASDWIGY